MIEGQFDALQTQLNSELKWLGLEVPDRDQQLLLAHLDLVLEANQCVNLTRITDPSEAVTLHIVDSLLLYRYFSASQEKTHLPFLDIGTGAGFPGIPLSIVSHKKGVLVDSTQKKIKEVSSFISTLRLGRQLETRAIRAEALSSNSTPNSTSKYGTVVARAVGQIATLLEYASPLLCKHGSLILSKGKLTDKEYDDGDYAAELLGMKNVSHETLSLPHDAGTRTILCYTKECPSRIKLPRRTGMAQHHPLIPKQ